ncbi:SRPBCC family protein [Streptomyces sp. NPDC087212]|uniref:SRPBCC family protein n=1 Tax=Streptomyces sp. NPDC087212 TaxID=3365766 RepID=UPI0037F4C81C
MEGTGARFADHPTVEVRTWIDAPPARVWPLVCDITLMPETSDELQSVEWLDGATGPAPGARFLGHNHHERVGSWTTTSSVVECDPGRVFGWAVGEVTEPIARWRFRLSPEGGGTGLSEWVRLGPGRSRLREAVERMPEREQEIVQVRLREFERRMTTTLDHIKSRAERAWPDAADARAERGSPARVRLAYESRALGHP